MCLRHGMICGFPHPQVQFEFVTLAISFKGFIFISLCYIHLDILSVHISALLKANGQIGRKKAKVFATLILYVFRCQDWGNNIFLSRNGLAIFYVNAFD